MAQRDIVDIVAQKTRSVTRMPWVGFSSAVGLRGASDIA